MPLMNFVMNIQNLSEKLILYMYQINKFQFSEPTQKCTFHRLKPRIIRTAGAKRPGANIRSDRKPHPFRRFAAVLPAHKRRGHEGRAVCSFCGLSPRLQTAVPV